jgi:hypothetical protein
MSRFFQVVFCFFLFYPVKAQKILVFSDNNEKINFEAISDSQMGYLVTLYNQRFDESNKLINGRDYYPYYFKSKIKPLLFDEKKKSGSLVRNGRRYDSLPLEYDTYLDKLIYYDNTKFIENKPFMISLNEDLIDGFNMYLDDDSLIFRHFKTEECVKYNLREGFYELVYNGISKYIIKHHSSLVQNESVDEYRLSQTGYVMVGEIFSRLRSTGEFVELFGKNSESIRKFMRTNRIHFRKAGKNEIASVLRYYDTLVMSNR